MRIFLVGVSSGDTGVPSALSINSLFFIETNNKQQKNRLLWGEVVVAYKWGSMQGGGCHLCVPPCVPPPSGCPVALGPRNFFSPSFGTCQFGCPQSESSSLKKVLPSTEVCPSKKFIPRAKKPRDKSSLKFRTLYNCANPRPIATTTTMSELKNLKILKILLWRTNFSGGLIFWGTNFWRMHFRLSDELSEGWTFLRDDFSIRGQPNQLVSFSTFVFVSKWGHKRTYTELLPRVPPMSHTTLRQGCHKISLWNFIVLVHEISCNFILFCAVKFQQFCFIVWI